MIPVLICPIVNRPDLLRRMLASVDVPVERTIVVDMMDIPEPWEAEVIRPLVSLGYPGAINTAILQTPGAPWWLFASNDLYWRPGDLATITERMVASDAPAFVTGSRADDRMLRHAYGAVNLQAIQAVGLMDEHAFFPVYFDDDDWERRCHLGGVDWIVYDGNIGHDRSSTIGSDPRAAEGNGRTFTVNRQAYLEKWGGLPGQEVYQSPYNLPVPLSFVRPDPAKRAERLW